jgi:hypothetical protein
MRRVRRTNDGKPDLAIFDQVIHIAYALLNTTPVGQDGILRADWQSAPPE